jgi:hypothetical protein
MSILTMTHEATEFSQLKMLIDASKCVYIVCIVCVCDVLVAN